MSDSASVRLLYPDLLRVIAIFGVVLLHVGDFGLPNETAQAFYRDIRTWCVPVFVMLSGMFFLNPAKAISLKILYGKYILRLVLALCFWGLVYALAFWVLPSGNLSWENIVRGFKTYHLWFMYMILGLYITGPVIRAFVAQATPKLLLYALALFAVFGVCLPFINGTVSLGMLQSLYAHLNIKLALGFTGYFVLGYYLATYDISGKAEGIIYILGLAGLACCLRYNGYFMQIFQQQGVTSFYLIFMTPYTFCMALAVFVLAKNHADRLIIGGKMRAVAHFAARHVFGIYLCHALWVQILLKVGLADIFAFSHWLYQPLMAVVVFALSLFTAVVFSLIPFLKRFV